MLYTVRRIFVVLDWINDVWLNKTLPANAELSVILYYNLSCLVSFGLLYYFIPLLTRVWTVVSGRGVVLVWEDTGGVEHGLLFGESLLFLDTAVPAEGVREVF